MDISVVIPAFNEAGKVPRTIARVGHFLEAPGADVEVLVVDDGSFDGTADAAEAAGPASGGKVRVLRHGANRGKGAAVRTGVLASRGDVVVVTDADGNYITGGARAYLDAIRGGADVVLASRAHRRSTWQVTAASARYVHRRRAMGRVFNAFVRAIVGLSLGDTQTGLKLFRGDAARELFRDLVLDRYVYDVELLCRARRRGMRVVELPIVYSVPRPESSIARLDPCRMALDLLRVRWLCRAEPLAEGAAVEEAPARERESVAAR
ncbi:MAG: glycosyltransferase [Planctomycetota bacterium]